MSPLELSAVAELERRVVASDGGRLKLEWGMLRSRSGGDPRDLLWWDGERLLGLYGFGGSTVEIAGMVEEAGFGTPPPPDLLDRLRADTEPTLLLERDGEAVGTLRVTREDRTAGIYGFVVDPAWQGRGIGPDALPRVAAAS